MPERKLYAIVNTIIFIGNRDMNREQLKQFYIEEGCPTGHILKAKKYKDFVKAVKKELAFISEMGGRKEFSVYLYALMNDVYEPPKCSVCGNDIKTAHANKFPKTCSRVCNGKYTSAVILEENGEYNIQRSDVRQKARETCIRKYGTSHHMSSDEGKKQYKETMMRNHGYENNFQRPECIEKIKDTNIRKYGHAHPMKNEKILKKATTTLKDRTGYDNPLKNPETFEKVKKTNKERHGEEFYTKTKEYKERMAEFWNSQQPEHGRRGHIGQNVIDILRDPDQMEALYNEYGGVELAYQLKVHNTTVYDWLSKHGIKRARRSFLEESFSSFLDEIGIEYIRNDRQLLEGLEVDFLIPQLGIGFEMDGIWWHSSAYVDKNFHKMKTDMSANKGVALFHIFEDEWNQKREHVKRKVRHLLKASVDRTVYARKTVFEKKNPIDTKKFFEDNHIQGYGRGSFCGVLRDETGETVAAAVFMKDPSSPSRVILNRYATSCSVVGGMSKIVANSRQYLIDMGFDEIVSYADLRWSNGALYESSGWVKSGMTPPDYTYVVGSNRVRKQNFRKSVMKRRYEEYDDTLTEWQNTEKMGIPRIYDCGLARYVFPLTPHPNRA